MGGVASVPMVGRDRELAQVTLLLEDALAGSGRLVLCTGEAGIGKTRLAEEAAASASARGVPVAWARAADRDSLPPYGLWQLVLAEPAVRAAGDGPFRADLWSRVFGDAERPALADGADSGSAQRFALFAEVRRRLAQAARPGGLLLVLDDLQWADEASAVLLADVVRQLRGMPILVLATYRESAVSGDTSTGLLRLSADANTERVDLRGLPVGAVGDMLLAAGLSAAPEQASEVHSETGGNPFLVRELARMLAEQRRGGPVPVPGRVVEATAYRLAQLSGPARALVQTAAVAGNSFSAGVAAQSLAFEEAVRLYRQALSVGDLEIGDHDRSRLELALAVAQHRSGDLPGSQETAAGVGRRAERRRDRFWLARTALIMEATGVPEWDGEICRVCEQARAGDDLPDDLLARVSSQYAQALVYRGEYDRAGEVSRDALAAAESAGDPVALVDALQARQLACCAPDGVAERAVLASRMLEAADAAGSAWLEMWGRLWRIDTLFETGQLRSVRRELADLEGCVERLPGPLGQWHYLVTAATLALATGRFTEATRLAADAFKAFNDMGHPVAFGGCAVILGQAGLHIGLDRSGFIDLFAQIPAYLLPDAVDTTRRTATIFPALSFALIRLHQGDRAAAETAYAQAGPVQSWTPVPAMRMAAWAHGLSVAIGLGRTQDIEFLAARFEPFRGQHVANGAGSGVYMGPVELPLGQAAAALGRLDQAVEDLETAAAICDANDARGCAVQARVELAVALTRRQAPGDRDRALALLGAAAGEAEQLRMVPFTEWIEQLRARRPATAAGDSPLSPRELEVARLVGRGLTNKQIGQNLYLSERTAENHVQHILTKLGLRNRSQIAAWASGEHEAGRP